MVCPVCNCEAIITGSRLEYNEATKKLSRVITYTCRNKKCKKYLKDIGEDESNINVTITNKPVEEEPEE